MSNRQGYTVKQLANLAGVTPRTLRHYHAIGLLRPSSVGNNGYRHYDEAAALRLQQILFYRELDLGLAAIAALLAEPGFDAEAALGQHREALQQRVDRMRRLIATIDKTLLHLRGQTEMSTDELFAGFDEETQARYEQEAAEMYDPKLVAETSRRWKNTSDADKVRIMAEGGAVYRDLVPLLDRDPASAAVQAVIGRWHQHLRAFYEPTADILRGLGQAYEDDPRFAAFYAAMHPQLPGFLRRAINHYVDNLAGRPDR